MKEQEAKRFWDIPVPEPAPYRPPEPSPWDLVYARMAQEDQLHKEHASQRVAAHARVEAQLKAKNPHGKKP